MEQARKEHLSLAMQNGWLRALPAMRQAFHAELSQEFQPIVESRAENEHILVSRILDGWKLKNDKYVVGKRVVRYDREYRVPWIKDAAGKAQIELVHKVFSYNQFGITLNINGDQRLPHIREDARSQLFLTLRTMDPQAWQDISSTRQALHAERERILHSTHMPMSKRPYKMRGLEVAISRLNSIPNESIECTIHHNWWNDEGSGRLMFEFPSFGIAISKTTDDVYDISGRVISGIRANQYQDYPIDIHYLRYIGAVSLPDDEYKNDFNQLADIITSISQTRRGT